MQLKSTSQSHKTIILPSSSIIGESFVIKAKEGQSITIQPNRSWKISDKGDKVVVTESVRGKLERLINFLKNLCN